MTFPRKLTVFLSLLLATGFGQDVDELIQFEEDPEEGNRPADQGEPQEEDRIVLNDLTKPGWRQALEIYDTNRDGKLTGDELLMALPVIQTLMEDKEESTSWWQGLILSLTPYMGVLAAAVIGGLVFIFALRRVIRASDDSIRHRNEQAIKNQRRRQQWLDSLEGRKKDGISASEEECTQIPESESDDDRSMIKLQKRKPESMHNLVTSKMPRYQHLSAVRRLPGNHSNQSDTAGNLDSMNIYQQLLPDEDEIAENSTDEIKIGNTRKRRPNVVVDEKQQKVAKDGAAEVLEVKVASGADALDDESDTLNIEAKNALKTLKFDESIDSVVSETTKDVLEGELNPEMRMAAILRTLSHVLDCKVVTSAGKRTTFTFQDKTLKVNVLQLPNQLDDVPIKITAIVEVMTVRQLNKVKLAAGCFDRATENLGLSGDSVVQEVCSVLAEYFTNMIIREIDKEEETWDDDDLWAGDDADTESKSVDILHRIGGCYDDPDDISPTLLNKLLQHQRAHNFLSTLLQYAGKQLRSVRRMDEMLLQEGRILNALDILLSNPLCGGLLGRVLEEELEEAANGLGNFFERTSIFGSLLSLTTVPANHKGSYALKSLTATAFTELRGFPKCAESDLRLLESTIQLALQRCQNIVFSALKKVLTNKTTREVALAWLAAAINLNEIRTNWTPEPDSQESIGCNDGFMLNFCTVLIEFFLPAVTSPELLTKVDLGYSSSDACRLNFSFEICLAGGQIVSENSGEKKIGTLDDNLQGKFNFLTECFHLSQRALSIGVIPAISHYNRLHRRFSQQLELVKGTPQEEGVQRLHTLLALMWDASLTNPELVRKVSQFYLSQSQLLLTLIDRAIEGDGVNPKKKLLSRIPEFCVKDMAVWFGFVARHAVFVHKDVLSGLSLSPFVDCCVMLLSHPELMPGPLPASKVVSAVGAFVLSSKKQGRGWGNDVHSDLALMVLACPSVREGLGGALVRTYVSVNVVEGLDVDKEEFDKYTTRAEITLLIRTLWDQVDSRASILDLANTKLFQDFLGSALDTLLYMLHDALGRMANVRKMEAAKDDAEEWAKLSPVEQRDKENFLRAESTVGVGFMRQANQTLGFLELLTKSEEVAKCFTRAPLNQRAASAISGFLESLCGPNCKDLKVKNMEKYKFDPQSLVFQIVSVILRIAEQDVSQSESFVVSMAADPDFSPPALEKALSVLSRTQLAQPAELETFAKLIDTMKAMHRISKVNEAACTRADNSTQWQEAANALTIDVESLMKEYQSALSSLRFGATDLQESHSFQANAQDSDPGSAKVKALMKEMKQLRGNLPVHPDAAIIVRQDEERIDLMRALVTGPVDTPYSRGCFLFDVYFPNNYPNIPPLLKIITTGNGTVRFNPNLYSDGKVCLSLLGTWHAGDASEKWIPSKSSLYQVLVSIQSLILIPDPMFNEPGYEGVRGTTEGDARSKAYNRKLRLWTVRHAMLGQLRSPPQGFEDLIKQHFTIQKDAVLKQCSDWLKDCDDADEEKRLRSVVNSLREELAKLGDDKPVKYELDDDDDLYS